MLVAQSFTSMPPDLAFVPDNTNENSPALQRWEWRTIFESSPVRDDRKGFLPSLAGAYRFVRWLKIERDNQPTDYVVEFFQERIRA